MKLWDDIFLSYLDDFSKIFSHVPNLLKQLQLKGITCAINTNRSKTPDFIYSILKKHSINHFFTSVQTPISTGVPKPNPKGILSICSSQDIQMENCYVVGDSIVDVLTGKNAGVKTIAVASGFFNKTDLKEYSPNYLIEDIALVHDIILKHSYV